MTPYGRLGAVLSFSILVLVCGGGLTMLFLPSLMSAAETANDLLRQAARPLVPVVVAGLRFIFLGGCRRTQEGCVPAEQGGGVPDLPVGGGGEWGLLHTIITWGLAGFAGIMGLAIVIFGAAWLLRSLASRGLAEKKEASLWQVLLRMVRALRTAGGLAAVVFPGQNDQGVKFVVKGWVFREMIHKERLNVVVGGLLRGHVMSGQDAVGIGVHHKDRSVGRIQNNAVRGFVPHAVDR